MSRIPPDTYGRLRQFTRSHRMTMQQVSLAAVSLALQYHAEAVDIVLGVPHLGRRDSRDQDAVGLFLEPLPVRIRYPPPPSSDQPVTFPISDQESSQRASVHALPWHQIFGAAGVTQVESDSATGHMTCSAKRARDPSSGHEVGPRARNRRHNIDSVLRRCLQDNMVVGRVTLKRYVSQTEISVYVVYTNLSISTPS
ncbi:hypothetical protein Daus18300_014198 [Diaporthe australafricana]|uniref:Condensation domain-containing protein n=1 Tax=Diaporthe australafricana TaxID=127596 RepID=A0ABR3VW56_9PEZI